MGVLNATENFHFLGKKTAWFFSFDWFIVLFITKLEMAESHTGTIDPEPKIRDVIFPEILLDTFLLGHI